MDLTFYTLVLFFIVLNALDVWTTTVNLKAGQHEINPLMKLSLKFSGNVWPLKLALVALILAVAFYFGSIGGSVFLTPMIAGGIFCVWYNTKSW